MTTAKQRRYFLYVSFHFLLILIALIWALFRIYFEFFFYYELHGYLKELLFTGQSPTKREWKAIVDKSVCHMQNTNWNSRTSGDEDFRRFRSIINSVELAPFWKHAKTQYDLKNYYLVTKILTDVPNMTAGFCFLCKRLFPDMYVHACCACLETKLLLDICWDLIIENFPLCVFTNLYERDEIDLFEVLLGKPIYTPDEVDIYNFCRLCHIHVVQSLGQYNRLLRQAGTGNIIPNTPNPPS